MELWSKDDDAAVNAAYRCWQPGEPIQAELAEDGKSVTMSLADYNTLVDTSNSNACAAAHWLIESHRATRTARRWRMACVGVLMVGAGVAAWQVIGAGRL